MGKLINIWLYEDEYYPYIFFRACDEGERCNIKMTNEQYEYHKKKKEEFKLWQKELLALGMAGGGVDG
jgi:hypothetical protein